MMPIIYTGKHRDIIEHKSNIWNVLDALSLKYRLIKTYCSFSFQDLCSLAEQWLYCQKIPTLLSNDCIFLKFANHSLLL